MSAIGDAVAKKLGPFTVGRKLGAGGMATVYAARREGAKQGELVALKVLAPNVSNEDPEHRAFIREAAIATRLEHENIVRTYEIAQYDGLMVLSMELVHGVPLGMLQKAAKAPAPIDIALRVACDVARALQTAHELVDEKRGMLGLVHQDVSPHNIMIGYDGVTKLVDFGVARLGMLEGSRTESLKGKPSYASPEQINGKNIDRRTDIFALGVVLWEMLAGQRLFRRETSAATYLAVLQDPIPDVREKSPSVPATVAEVVARALNRDREQRWATAEAFRLALDEARGERIPEASTEELSFWVAQLVPPKLTFPELQRELEDLNLPVSGAQVSASSASSPLPPDAVVPDLDMPAPKRSPKAPVVEDELAAKPTVMPPVMPPPSAPDLAPAPARRQSSPNLAPPVRAQSSPNLAGPRASSPALGKPAVDSVDEFDMEIEREGALAATFSASNMAANSARGRVLTASTGLEVAHRRTTAGTADRRALDDDEASLKVKILAWVGTVMLFAGAVAALLKLAHRSGGRSLFALVPHAFDGTSVVHAGVVSGVALVLAIVIGFLGLRMRPRSWAFVVAGGAMLVTSIAMVTVTLVSTEENPTPPDGAMLIPYTVPIALVAIAVGIAGRAVLFFTDYGVARKVAGVPIAAIAGALAFLALEASKMASLFG